MDINPRNQPTSRKSDDAGHLVPSSISSHENIVSDPAMLERVPGSGHKPAQKPAQKPDGKQPACRGSTYFGGARLAR